MKTKVEIKSMVGMVQARINELLASPKVQNYMMMNIRPEDAQEYLIKTAIATLVIPPEQR